MQKKNYAPVIKNDVADLVWGGPGKHKNIFFLILNQESISDGSSEFVSKIPLITLASRHAATISLDSSLKRADRNTYKMMTTITLPICNLIHLYAVV
jgi:hypothetical protein